MKKLMAVYLAAVDGLAYCAGGSFLLRFDKSSELEFVWVDS